MANAEVLSLSRQLSAAQRWGWDESKLEDLRHRLAVAVAADKAKRAVTELTALVADGGHDDGA
jgi:hypothetical protein